MKNVQTAAKLGDEEASNLYYSPFEDKIDKGHALVIAPRYPNVTKDEEKSAKYPYEECLFFFSADLSKDYPNSPPHLKHETPAIKNYRLHPNLYEHAGAGREAYSGKVCLGILGTWGANDWNSSMSISDVLQGIMGILEANPGTYEPGCTSMTAKNTKGIHYNQHVFYEAVETTCKIYDMVIEALPSKIEKEGPIDFKTRGVPEFIIPFLEPLARRAYDALHFLSNKINEFIEANDGKSEIKLDPMMHHNAKHADFGALKKCIDAVREKIPTPLRKSVFKFSMREIWRELYEISKPKRKNGDLMSYEEFAEEKDELRRKELRKEKERKTAELGEKTCSMKNTKTKKNRNRRNNKGNNNGNNTGNSNNNEKEDISIVYSINNNNNNNSNKGGNDKEEYKYSNNNS